MATKPKPEAPTAVARKPGRLLTAAIRMRVISGLMDKGYSRVEARRLWENVDDEMIAEAADHVGVTAIGDGAFLDWLMDGGLEKILEIVKIIIELLTGGA